MLDSTRQLGAKPAGLQQGPIARSSSDRIRAYSSDFWFRAKFAAPHVMEGLGPERPPRPETPLVVPQGFGPRQAVDTDRRRDYGYCWTGGSGSP